MNLFTWNNSYSVGIRRFDEQHKYLFTLLNQLHEAMRNGQGQQSMTKLLENLIRYVNTHFQAEEALMQARKYPDLARHRVEHARLTAEVVRFKADFDAGRVGLSVEVMEFLQKWLQQHILEEDQRYSAYFATSGVA